MKIKSKRFQAVLYAAIFLGLTLSQCKEIRKTCVVAKSDGALLLNGELKNSPPEGYFGKQEYVNKVREVIEDLSGLKIERLVTVGHQVGNFEAYPKFPGEIRYTEFESAKEMLYSYQKLGFDGIELDLQLGPELKIPYIVHERITDVYRKINPEWEKVKPFFDKNSFENLLKDFIEKELYKKDKHIYVELKAKDAYKIDEIEEQTVQEAVLAIERLLQGRRDAGRIRDKIAFISFNHMALQKVMDYTSCRNRSLHAACPDDAGYRFYYLAVSNLAGNKLYGALLCPEFNDADYLFTKRRQDALHQDLWDMLNTNRRLSGIWLLPGAITGAAKELSRLNDRRAGRLGQDALLEFYLSTYQVPREAFFHHLHQAEHRGKYANYYSRIRGLVFDVKR